MRGFFVFMQPTAQPSIPPVLQQAIERRRNGQNTPVAPSGGNQPPQAQTPPQAAPAPQPAPAPTPPTDLPAPTPAMPFDPAEIKMIEGALINRLKALTDAQFPEPPEQGGI